MSDCRSCKKYPCQPYMLEEYPRWTKRQGREYWAYIVRESGPAEGCQSFQGHFVNKSEITKREVKQCK